MGTSLPDDPAQALAALAISNPHMHASLLSSLATLMRDAYAGVPPIGDAPRVATTAAPLASASSEVVNPPGTMGVVDASAVLASLPADALPLLMSLALHNLNRPQ